MEFVQPNTSLGQLLDWCQQQSATDLHGQSDKPYCIRVHGQLLRVSPKIFPPPAQAELLQAFRENFSTETMDRIERHLELDLSFYCGGVRYRANFSKQKGQQSFSFRTVPQQRLKLQDLQLPDSLTDLIKEPRGLILV